MGTLINASSSNGASAELSPAAWEYHEQMGWKWLRYVVMVFCLYLAGGVVYLALTMNASIPEKLFYLILTLILAAIFTVDFWSVIGEWIKKFRSQF